MLQQGIVLKDDAQLSAQLLNLFALDMVDVVVQHADGPCFIVHFSIHGLEEAALSAAYRTNDIDHFAFADVH